MYYPYLRAKQFELKAIKEFFDEFPEENNIIPILEPVNLSYSALSSAISFLEGKRKRYALIMNPRLGDFRHDNIHFDFVSSNQGMFSSECFVPAFLAGGDLHDLSETINEFQSSRIMLIFPSGADTGDVATRSVIGDEKVQTIVCAFTQSPRRTKNYMLELGKQIITLEDCFNEQKRNADYANQIDETFSDTFRYYAADHYNGFSDYTSLPSSFSTEGMLPYALVIHLTYELRNDQINIHHFVSESNRDQSNIRGKFYEAARKVEDFYNDRFYRTSIVDEIIKRANDDNGFPGLGYLKKLSVKNHLELIHHLIG